MSEQDKSHDETGQSNESKGDHWKSFTEEVEVAGRHLVEEVTRLISEGNVRKLRIRSSNDDVVLEIPLNAGAAVGGVFVLAAPWLAILGALAGLLAKVRLEVVRDVKDDQTDSSREAPEDEKPD